MREDGRRPLRRRHGRAGSTLQPGAMGGFEPETSPRRWSEGMGRSSRRRALSTELGRDSREKSRIRVRPEPVPQTDTGWQVEHTEALREPWLRNSATWCRTFGRRHAWVWRGGLRVPSACSGRSSQRATTVYQKHRTLRTCERGRIGSDACPVPEG